MQQNDDIENRRELREANERELRELREWAETEGGIGAQRLVQDAEWQFRHWLSDNERAGEILDNFETLFGQAVSASRRVRGWSQRELAEAVRAIAPDISLDSSAITRIEAGKRTVSFKQAVALAAALDEQTAEAMIIDAVVGGSAPSMLDWAVQLRQQVAALEAEAARAEAEHLFKERQLRGYQHQLKGVLAVLKDDELETYSERANDG